MYVNEVVWILPWKAKEIKGCYRTTATYGINALYSDKYPIKAKVMFYDEKNDLLFKCEKLSWKIHIEQTDFGGGYDKNSRRWCELKILKTFNLENKK